MLEPAYQADVVVVGAGVAGLAAAHRLISAGVTTAVLEAAPYVGGRMSTEKVDGFRLDRIGQFLSTSYPELRLTPGLGALVLRPFAPGVLLHSDGRHHHAGTPAPGGSAWGALHAVRALASAPRAGAVPRVRRGSLWGGPVTRGFGGVAWAAAAPGAAAGASRGGTAFRDRAGAPRDGATSRNRTETSRNGAPPKGRTGTPGDEPAPEDRAAPSEGLAAKDRTASRGGPAGASWGALRNRAGTSPGDRTDPSWGGPTVKDRAAGTRGSSAVPRSRAGAPSAARSTRPGSAPR